MPVDLSNDSTPDQFRKMKSQFLPNLSNRQAYPFRPHRAKSAAKTASSIACATPRADLPRAQHHQSCIYPPDPRSRGASSSPTFESSHKGITKSKIIMPDKEKPQSWAMTAYLDPTQPPALRDESSATVGEATRLDNGAYTNAPAPLINRYNKHDHLPVWNLRVATITVFVMFAVGPVLCAFGLLMRDDLSNEYVHTINEPQSPGMVY